MSSEKQTRDKSKDDPYIPHGYSTESFAGAPIPYESTYNKTSGSSLTSLSNAPSLPGVKKHVETKFTPIGNEPLKNPLIARIIAQGKKNPLTKEDGVAIGK